VVSQEQKHVISTIGSRARVQIVSLSKHVMVVVIFDNGVNAFV
jgi:hypothetical protein